MSYSDNDGIKRRREERVRRLREQMEDTYSSYFFAEEEQPPVPYYSGRPVMEREEFDYPVPRHPSSSASTRERKKGPLKRKDRWFIRIMLSFCLLSAAYVVHNGQFPGSEKYRSMMNEIMNRSYDFQAMSAWYEKKFGAIPTMLPSLGSLGGEAQPVLTSNVMLLKAPAPGPVIKPYQEQGSGLYFQPADKTIKSVDKGWVTFVGDKPGLGRTIVIQHDAHGTETWYGGLGQVNVSVNDWVDVQTKIATAAAQGNTVEPVYFAVKKDGKFVNPADVVRFEK
ncbi:M23 family metallopeptidase [Aneurinibacillus sp. Ricciae_BoGa-3]|uniref:M23 family metallopeptidase n=1 Tax=Aneurinibacillus sp. Ricciae_BoGa-3 TaxID=3022697 RepID=UPI002340DAEF|nr:M23 family metallopeptidase [Aneurinibacillus sp. Ricciae_BoGa-3]WCK53638.1 M23 family metallopeptidase [Aneurinibacillus sp. Ricciae_BoGa-3]